MTKSLAGPALLALLALVLAAPALAQEAETAPGAAERPPAPEQQAEPVEPAATEQQAEPEKKPRGTGMQVLMYLPNRVFDLLDILRLRGRAGPGMAVGVRATEAFSVFAGGYGSIGVGLPGPRLEPVLPLPVGLDVGGGVQVSLAGDDGSEYSPTEIGAVAHLVVVGLDLGIDPFEIIDFLGGFVLWDPRGDDL